MQTTWAVAASQRSRCRFVMVESSWNVMAHGDARKRKWRGNWQMEWVASTLHTTSEHGVSSITTADAHTSTASSRLNWRPSRFKWTRPFRRKTKSGFCTCTFQTQSNYTHYANKWPVLRFQRSESRRISQYFTIQFLHHRKQCVSTARTTN
jgi:hypothetical protein